MLVRAVAGVLDDPFRVVELGRDGAGQMADEAATIPLSGGRRVVLVRDVTEAALEGVSAVLGGRGDALVILEAPGLSARSKLRTAIEAAAAGVAIGCYTLEGQALEQAVRDMVAELGAAIDPEALGLVCGQLGANHAQTRREAEKLALFAGPGGKVDLHAAIACIGDASGLSLDDALYAATSGDVAGLDRALTVAFESGQAPASVLRAALGHVHRLLRARQVVARGASAEQAIGSLRPPVFWRRKASLERTLGLWGEAALERALTALDRAERDCRRTGSPAETICRATLSSIATQAKGIRPSRPVSRS